MAVLDTNIVNVAIPSMHADLHASGALLQLIVAGYTMRVRAVCCSSPARGSATSSATGGCSARECCVLRHAGVAGLPDWRRRNGCGVLVGLRFAQGVGAAVMIPQVLSLLQRTHTRRRARGRGTTMSLYATVISGGAVLRPGGRRPADQRGRVRPHVAVGLPGEEKRAHRGRGAAVHRDAARRAGRMTEATARPARAAGA